MRRDRLIWIGVILLVSTAAWLAGTRYNPRDTPERVPTSTTIAACHRKTTEVPHRAIYSCKEDLKCDPPYDFGSPVGLNEVIVGDHLENWLVCCPQGYTAAAVNNQAGKPIDAVCKRSP
jgi:hypothetical protein